MTDRPQWTDLLGLLFAGHHLYGGDFFSGVLDYGVYVSSNDWRDHLLDARAGVSDYTVIRRGDGTAVMIVVNP